MRKSTYRKLIVRQKLIGILMLIVSVLIILVASYGVTLVDRDCGPVIFLIPFSLYLVFTKHLIVH